VIHFKITWTFKISIILLAWCYAVGLSGQNTKRFERFSTLDGLGNNYISNIKTDPKGFLWLATYDGLSRYDGYDFVNFKPEHGNKFYTGSNIINVMWPDTTGNIWFGTTGTGLSAIDPESGNFKNYSASNKGAQQLFGNNVMAITGTNNQIWIGTAKGLNILDLKSDCIKTFSLSGFGISNHITALHAFKDGYVWVGSEQGLQLLKYENEQLISYPYFNAIYQVSNKPVSHIYKDNKHNYWIVHPGKVQAFSVNSENKIVSSLSLSSNRIRKQTRSRLRFNTFIQEDDKHYWIGTTNGIVSFYFDSTGNPQITLSQHELFNPESLSGNTITSLHKDREGVIWIGTRYSGLNKFDPYKQPFTKYIKRLGETGSMRSNDVRTILEDNANNIWLGYRNEGLDKLHANNKRVDHFTNDQSNNSKIASNIIRGMFQDSMGQIWLGSAAGISRLEHKGSSHQFKTVTPVFSEGKVRINTVYEFFEDSKNRFWAGSTSGLILYDRNTNAAKLYSNDLRAEVGNRNFIRCIAEDDNGMLWLATDGGGLDHFNPETGQFTNYRSDLNNSLSISNNKIYAVLFDSQKRLWVGTHSGLNCLEPGNQGFRLFTESEGLANNVVYSVNEDHDGYIWVSTANGLSRISPNTRHINNYLQGFEFSDDAWWQNKKGELFYGGLNGFYKFNPAGIQNNNVAPKVYIAGFNLQSKQVKTGQIINERVILNKPITQTDSIELEHHENFFTFDLLAISLSKPKQIHYQYQLEGFNNEWVDAAYQERKAVFTNVPHGHYTFKLKAANADGVWSDVKKISITIHPAYYQTIWFQISLSVLLVLLLLIGYRLRLRSLTLQKNKLKFEVEAKTKDLREQKDAIEQQNNLLERQKHEIEEQRDKLVEMTRQIHEADERKIRFFTSISHEIRTPLTLISAPIEKLLSTIDANDKSLSDLHLVQRNTQRLLNLVNQLLDFRKIDTGHMRVQTRKADLSACISTIFDNCKPLADKKQIELSLHQSAHSFELCFDADAVEKVVLNLLSNALKYTPEKGHVKLSLVQLNDNNLCISVCDTGPGIEESQRQAIFKRFYRNEQDAHGTAGTGIGLALAKELAILQGGDINIKNNAKGGSCFEFILPRIMESSQTDIKEPQQIHFDMEPPVKPKSIDNYSVLIIEDNDDLRDFIKSSLHAKEVYEAANGQKGIEMAFDKMPDIIISDVLMPGKNGYEVCRILKQDERTNHIPVILLTALGAEENQQIGIDSGADDYIVKPFNHRILAGKINNIMLARQQFKASFDQKLSNNNIEPNWKLNLPPFLNQVINTIEQHADDASFGVEELGKTLGMSRSTLYRKLKSLSNKSAVEFVRDVRMRLALVLLQNDPHITVAELAMKVGFEDTDYFRQCFKKQFGKTPRELMQ